MCEIALMHRWYTEPTAVTSLLASSRAVYAAVPPAVPPLVAAAVAYLAAQGFGRFGFGLVLPAMRDALGLSTGEMGLLAGIGLAAYLFSSVPAGALAARIGSRWTIVAGLLGTAAGLAATGFANGFVVAAYAQAIVGASAPLAIVPILAIGGRWVRPSFRGRATGLVVAGGGIGLLLAGLIVPLLLAPGDPMAWRRAWWGLAAGVLAAAGVSAIFLRDPPPGYLNLDPSGSDHLDSASSGLDPASSGDSHPHPPAARHPGFDPATSGQPEPGPAVASRPLTGQADAGPDAQSLAQAVYRRGAVWRLALVFGLYGVSYIVYGTFFVAHLERHGLDAATAGRLWSLAGLVAIGSGLLGGALADRLGPSTALVIMFGLQGTGMATLALGDGIGWLTLSVVVYGVSLWGFPAAISKACTELVGPRLAPAALGLLAMAFALGQAGGPVVAGLLADRFASLAPGLLFGALCDAAGAGVAWVTHRDRPSAA
jgi:predicted MFS family arabinose efflux permease